MAPWGKKTMIVTTTPTVEGRSIATYHGIVVGEAILGANVFRDIFAGITDIIGGRSGAYEASLGEARETALRELEERARGDGRECRRGRRSRLRGHQQHAHGVGERHRRDAALRRMPGIVRISAPVAAQGPRLRNGAFGRAKIPRPGHGIAQLPATGSMKRNRREWMHDGRHGGLVRRAAQDVRGAAEADQPGRAEHVGPHHRGAGGAGQEAAAAAARAARRGTSSRGSAGRSGISSLSCR
jgi:hypothetical protein